VLLRSARTSVPGSRLQRCGDGQAAPGRAPSAAVHDVLHSSGQPLDAETRASMQPRFGHDFTRVRVHADADAARSAQAVNALAYTVGQHIVFGAGHYAPSTQAGQRLLAHELTHVTQQDPRPGHDFSRVQVHGHAEADIQRQPAPPPKAPPPPPPPPPAPTYTNCSKEQNEAITVQLATAKSHARNAIFELEREFTLTTVDKAITRHFGKPGRAGLRIILERFKEVHSSIDNKTIRCVAQCATTPCARGETPGSLIEICPTFTRPECAPAAPGILLHEAIHNTGAPGDINKTASGYPPSDAENNAYSYEYFALDIVGGGSTPEPVLKRKPGTGVPRP
jgi:hypothetical protein